MGTSSFAVPALDTLIADGILPRAVYTQPDRKGGRGRRSIVSPIKERALDYELPIIQPETLRDPNELAQFKTLEPSILVVAAYGAILPLEYLELLTNGGLNIHPSLLPLHRGPSPIVNTILAGDTETGVSIFVMDEGMDTGPILRQKTTPVHLHETGGALTDRLSLEAAAILVPTLVDWINGDIEPISQDNNVASYSRLLKKSDGALNFKEPATILKRKVDAFNPWPSSFTTYKGKRLTILEAWLLDEKELEVAPGEILYSPSGNKILLGTSEGILDVQTIQLEGKRPVAATEFLRGYQDFAGSILPS
jgi:methionyl-tRNA formyltransferase